jgi:hypothetical protein
VVELGYVFVESLCLVSILTRSRLGGCLLTRRKLLRLRRRRRKSHLQPIQRRKQLCLGPARIQQDHQRRSRHLSQEERPASTPEFSDREDKLLRLRGNYHQRRRQLHFRRLRSLYIFPGCPPKRCRAIHPFPPPLETHRHREIHYGHLHQDLPAIQRDLLA